MNQAKPHPFSDPKLQINNGESTKTSNNSFFYLEILELHATIDKSKCEG